MSQINGRISQIIGPVIDVYFDTKGENPEKVLPKIYEALKVKRQTDANLSSRCSSTSVRIQFAVSLWIILTVCSAAWRLSLQVTQSRCQPESKSRAV